MSVASVSPRRQNVLRQDASDAMDFRSGPLVELDFWVKKEQNLASIYEQLHSERILKVTKVQPAYSQTGLCAVVYVTLE